MSLRLRLIVAFFLLSVVPLAAVTLYTYSTSAKVIREAAGHETELLSEELVQRMQLVTDQLSQRAEYLMEISALSDPEAMPAAATPSPTSQTTSASPTSRMTSDTLGQLAMLLNNVDIVQRRGGPGRGRGGGPTGGRSGPPRDGGPPPTGATPAGGVTTAPRAGEPPPPPGSNGGRGDRGRRPDRGPNGLPGPPGSPVDGRGETPTPSAAPPGSQPSATPAAADGSEPIRINLQPIRQEIISQFATGEEWVKLSSEERRSILEKVDQQMSGIERGIRMGTAEAQRRILEAQKAADAKAQEAAAVPSPPPAKAPAAPVSTKRRTQLQGSHIAVTVEQNGEVLRELNADVDLPNLLSTVFSTTRRDRGEVPFAVAADGQIYTPTEADRKTIQAIGTDAIKPGTSAGTTVLPSWVIVTSNDPVGSGLKFGIARPVGDSLQDLGRATARNVGMGLGFIGIALIGIVPLSGRLTRNLSVLSEGVDRIARGDYHARVRVSSHDEVGRLATEFNRMAAEVEQHQLAAVGQERIRRELELGRQIQADMLPQSPLRFGLTEICGVSVPAREVGGDFFNYFQLANGDIALLVGDVSGKGVGAALLMANIQASLRTRLALGQDLASIAHELDADVEANTPGPVYATLFVGLLNPTTREFRYVNAGHHPQIVLRQRGGLEPMMSSGLPVGLLAGRGYTEGKTQLDAGDLLFFYTDGCVEAGNKEGDMYGAERLEQVLLAGVGKGASELLAAVEQSVSSFRGAEELFDDATMMVARVG